MFKGLGDMGDLSKMMEAAQQMQTRMAEMQEGLTRLTVTGEGQSRIAPDMATVQLGVTTQAPTAAQAMSDNATRQTAIIEALRAQGLGTAILSNGTPEMLAAAVAAGGETCGTVPTLDAER
mgnify:CR=1 FL=1